MKSKFILLIIGVLILGLVFLNNSIDLNKNNGGIKTMDEKQMFQGPVQEGYDEQHFRLTGESKLLEIKE